MSDWTAGVENGHGLSHEEEQPIRGELGPQERLLWSGRPQRGLLFRASDYVAVPLTLIWCWVVFSMDDMFTGRAPWYFTPTGFLFAFVGFYSLIARWFVEAADRKRTRYALTTERILILRHLFRRTTKSLYLRTLPETSVSVRLDGSGTITLGRKSLWGGRRLPHWKKFLTSGRYTNS
jgi:hypothetical protein